MEDAEVKSEELRAESEELRAEGEELSVDDALIRCIMPEKRKCISLFSKDGQGNILHGGCFFLCV